MFVWCYQLVVSSTEGSHSFNHTHCNNELYDPQPNTSKWIKKANKKITKWEIVIKRQTTLASLEVTKNAIININANSAWIRDRNLLNKITSNLYIHTCTCSSTVNKS